jgi:hypothetical protein
VGRLKLTARPWNWGRNRRSAYGIINTSEARNLLLFAPRNEAWKQQIPHGLKRVCENPCRPYGTRIYFPLYPALRLRLRAGLD